MTETINNGLTKNQRWYSKHIRLGLCQQCSEKAVEGRTYCKRHLEMQHQYHVRRYKKRPYPIKPSKYLTNGQH